MNDLFRISATSPAGAPFTTTAPNPAAAFAAARMLLDVDGYIDRSRPVEWQLIPNAGLIVDCFVRVDSGPTHLVLIEPGQRITTRLETCCAAELAIDGDQVEITTARGARGIPCPLCRTTWAARFDQINARIAAVSA